MVLGYFVYICIVFSLYQTAIGYFKSHLKKKPTQKLMHLNKWDFFIYQKMGI